MDSMKKRDYRMSLRLG